MKRHLHIVILLLLSASACVQVKAHNPLYHNGPGRVMTGEVRPISDEDQQFTYYFYAARQALAVSRYDDALALAEFSHRLKPDDPSTNHLLGILYEALHRPDDARIAFEKAYQGNPNDYWERYYQFLCRQDNKADAKTARKVIESQYKRQPDNSDILDAYQSHLVEDGDFKKALHIQNQIDRVEGRTPYNVIRRYKLLLMQNKTADAVQVIENYCKEDPDDDYFQAFLGDIYLALGQKQKALLTYTLEYNRNPENPYLLESLARFYKAENAALEERKMLEQLIDIAPSDESLTRYFELISADTAVSNDQRVHFIQKAYLLEPNSAKWHYYWALALASQDSIRASLDVCRDGIALATEEPVIRFSLNALSGDLYMRLDSFEQCFAAYEAALMLDPDNVYVLNNYAYTLAIHGGDLKKAEKMSQKTIEKEPNNPTYLDTYAWILHLQGQNTLARFYIGRAVEKMDKDESNEELLMHYKTIHDE